MTYYYAEKPPSKPYARRIISDFIRGVPVEFIVEPPVFSANRVDPGTKLLLEVAEVEPNSLILDVGCGYGVIGITLAKAIPNIRVYMVDINKKAVELSKINAKLNGVQDRVIVLHGDLYEPVKDMEFNVIISNPPFTAGFNVVEKLIKDSINYLKEQGSIQLVVRKGVEKVKNLLLETYGNVNLLASKKGYKVFKSIKS